MYRLPGLNGSRESEAPISSYEMICWPCGEGSSTRARRLPGRPEKTMSRALGNRWSRPRRIERPSASTPRFPVSNAAPKTHTVVGRSVRAHAASSSKCGDNDILGAGRFILILMIWCSPEDRTTIGEKWRGFAPVARTAVRCRPRRRDFSSGEKRRFWPQL